MSLSAVQASAYLHHLHLESADPDRLSAFYASVMSMERSRFENGWITQGPARRLIISHGKEKSLASAGFAVRDKEGLEGLKARAQERGLKPESVTEPFFSSGAFCVTDPDGNKIVFGLSSGDNHTEKPIRGPLQHLTLATADIAAIEDFYSNGLGFSVSDKVVREDGKLMTCFMRGNHEHHNLACFLQDRKGIDHHSYEAGEWDTIRDWCDHFARHDVPLMWGPGRHGPGNNLFIFIKDPDENWIEVSAELEVVHDRQVKTWPHEERTLNKWGRAIMRA
ncbi:VOC family protein [Pseudorhodoplanes sinuspersici]|uniref:Uncharacterized protein n=1 Tax=Pseudorhodoplanes sinuspersici TaxID=1235591 RepID=A0A1W6ZS86_9HYPH|nr:VOC family protein [Pseudorhodoplanes sinuspersici]ARP99614.1 hypothetical protein CAK95_11355 [Pseudorhodoplanes sinuspersici]RKE70589.1 catechol-2,3-dioxygenase [Pseudorhodoplanes sinuspersici]